MKKEEEEAIDYSDDLEVQAHYAALNDRRESEYDLGDAIRSAEEGWSYHD